MKPKCFLRPQYILGRGSFMFKDLVHLAPISPWSHKTLPGKSKTYFFSGRKGITWFLSKNQVFKKKTRFLHKPGTSAFLEGTLDAGGLLKVDLPVQDGSGHLLEVEKCFVC